jgi:cytochrome b561
MLLVFVFIIPIGFYMTDQPLGLRKLKLYALHKSIGLSLLALAALRLAWRSAERRPTLPPMPAWQEHAATAAHVLLYVLMFAIPITGWLFNSAAGFPLQWFGTVNLPALTAQNPPLKALARELHEAGVWALVGLVSLHAAAALKHHFLDRDRTLSLMVPGVDAPRNGANP